MRVAIWAGVRPAQGPAVCPSPMHSATEPATCGVAMLVPDMTAKPPPLAVEVMHTPGAAIVWACPVAVDAQLEKLACESSVSPVRQAGAPPAAPGRPSLSLMAVTVRTSG